MWLLRASTSYEAAVLQSGTSCIDTWLIRSKLDTSANTSTYDVISYCSADLSIILKKRVLIIFVGDSVIRPPIDVNNSEKQNWSGIPAYIWRKIVHRSMVMWKKWPVPCHWIHGLLSPYVTKKLLPLSLQCNVSRIVVVVLTKTWKFSNNWSTNKSSNYSTSYQAYITSNQSYFAVGWRR